MRFNDCKFRGRHLHNINQSAGKGSVGFSNGLPLVAHPCNAWVTPAGN